MWLLLQICLLQVPSGHCTIIRLWWVKIYKREQDLSLFNLGKERAQCSLTTFKIDKTNTFKKVVLFTQLKKWSLTTKLRLLQQPLTKPRNQLSIHKRQSYNHRFLNSNMISSIWPCFRALLHIRSSLRCQWWSAKELFWREQLNIRLLKATPGPQVCSIVPKATIVSGVFHKFDSASCWFVFQLHFS